MSHDRATHPTERARRTLSTTAATLLTCGLVLAASSGTDVAEARSRGAEGNIVTVSRLGGPEEAALRQALQASDDPTTVVFKPGTYDFQDSRLFVFNRRNVVVCSSTGNPRDVTLRFAAASFPIATGGSFGGGLWLRGVDQVEFRGLTVENTLGAGLYLEAVRSDGSTSFVQNVSFRNCVFDAVQPVRATAAVRDVVFDRCRVNVTATNASGIEWGDGAGLQVTRCRFTTARTDTSAVDGFAAVSVFGVLAARASGARVPGIVLTRNRVNGRFLNGFALFDVVNPRIQRNVIRMKGNSDAIREATSGIGAAGRVGILVRVGAATAQPEGVDVRRNRVRGAHIGIYMQQVRSGEVDGNDLRGCGSKTPDPSNALIGGGDTFGGGLRVRLLSAAACLIDIDKNNLRSLKSPRTAAGADVPAVIVEPTEANMPCAQRAEKNRTSNGRPVFVGAAKR